MIRVFIGYDPHESSAYHVLSHSIHRYATAPVSITPIKLSELRQIYRRPRDLTHSTEFSISRFLVPALCDYEGWAIFLDTDMMLREDIGNLWALRDSRHAVQVVKHDYTPSTETKMLGQKQTSYPCKNWSSVMLLNCGKCKDLTLQYVHDAEGLALHRFHWTKEVGELPRRWNHLVGEYRYDEDAALVHWTLGGPWWEPYVQSDYSGEWFDMLGHMLDEEGDQCAVARLRQ